MAATEAAYPEIAALGTPVREALSAISIDSA
jgi:hypothetical protein